MFLRPESLSEFLLQNMWSDLRKYFALENYEARNICSAAFKEKNEMDNSIPHVLMSVYNCPWFSFWGENTVRGTKAHGAHFLYHVFGIGGMPPPSFSPHNHYPSSSDISIYRGLEVKMALKRTFSSTKQTIAQFPMSQSSNWIFFS